MRVSVVIIVSDVTSFLGEAIESVQHQGMYKASIIVVHRTADIALTKRIRDICAAYPDVTVLQCQDTDLVYVAKAALSHLQTEAVLFLSATDVLLTGAISHLIRMLNIFPKAIAVYGSIIQIDSHSSFANTKILPDINQITSGDLQDALSKGYSLLNIGNVCIRHPYLEQSLKLCTTYHNSCLWQSLAPLGDIIYAGDRPLLGQRSLCASRV